MKIRALGWLAVVGLVAGAVAGPMAGAVGAAPLAGAIWTSLADGATVNQNLYDSKDLVYLNGGPKGGGGGLPDGDYYFQVTGPSGGALLSTDAIKFRQVKVVNGVIAGVSGAGNHDEGTVSANGGLPVQLLPYNDTPNNGGEYSVDLAPAAAVAACDGFNGGDSTTLNFVKSCNVESKNDNFKVGEEPSPTPTPTPEPTPTPTPEPTPTPAPNSAHIFLTKLLDVDGDPATDDLVAGPGWVFDIAAQGGTPSDDSVTTDENGESEFDVEVGDQFSQITISENGQEGFEIMGADCAEILGESGFGEPFGELTGNDLSFTIEANRDYDCIFVNTGGEVEAATGTPAVTPPPTDAVNSTNSSGEGTRLLLLVIAGIIATMLVVTPAPARRRR